MAQAKEGQATIEVDPTVAEWHGVTFKEDLPDVVAYVEESTAKGEYPSPLWPNPTEAMVK